MLGKNRVIVQLVGCHTIVFLCLLLEERVYPENMRVFFVVFVFCFFVFCFAVLLKSMGSFYPFVFGSLAVNFVSVPSLSSLEGGGGGGGGGGYLLKSLPR